MARLIKSRARAPLAEGQLSSSWGESAQVGQRYALRVANETHSYTLDITPNETKSFIGFVASRETFVYGMSRHDGGMGFSDKRTLPEKLRAWADKLEAEGNMQRLALTD